MVLYYLYMVLQIYFYIMIIYILLTWTPLIDSEFGRLLRKITDPYLRLFRGALVFNGLDFTPMVGLLLYQFVLILLQRVI